MASASSHSEINFLVDVVGGKYRIFDEGMNKFVGEGIARTALRQSWSLFLDTLIYLPRSMLMLMLMVTAMTTLLPPQIAHTIVDFFNENYSIGTKYSAGSRSGTKVTILAEGTNGAGRKIKVEIDPSEPATDLWYVCQNHNGMGNESDIVTAAGSSDSRQSHS